MAGVLVIGVAVVDFVFSVDSLPNAAAKYRATAADVVGGGCAANAAVAVARLGGTAHLGSRIGDDVVGNLICSDLAAEGVDLSLVQRTSGARSSFSSVYVDAAGERQIMNFRGENLTSETDWIYAAPNVGAVLADTRWSAGADRALKLAREADVPGIVDAEAPMDADVLGLASHVAFSRDGLAAFAGDGEIATGLLAASEHLPGWVCVTDGENGTWIVADGIIRQVPTVSVETKDTLAAGDVWHGAFALALAEGRKELQAVRFANVTAALKCQTFGGRRGCPDRAAVDSIVKESNEWN